MEGLVLKKLIGVAAVAAMAVSGAAVAAGSAPVAKAPVARVAAVDGQVMVDRGEGFVAAGSHAFVSAGDQVRLSSAGEMVFADGCSVQVASLEAFAVAAASPCVPALTKTAFVRPQAEAGAGGVAQAGAAGGAATGAASTGGLFGLSVAGTAVAGVAAVGVAAVAISVADDDDDDPVSA